MKKSRPNDDVDDMRPEYDFSKGVRGKYASRFAKGSKVVVLEPDVAAKYASSDAVNAALREKIADHDRKATG